MSHPELSIDMLTRPDDPRLAAGLFLMDMTLCRMLPDGTLWPKDTPHASDPVIAAEPEPIPERVVRRRKGTDTLPDEAPPDPTPEPEPTEATLNPVASVIPETIEFTPPAEETAVPDAPTEATQE